MQHDLTRGPITRTMLLFAGPMIAGNLLQQFYNIADTLIVGQFLGAQALAAVGSAFTLMTFLTSILLGLCMGSGAVFSIRYGERNEEKLKSSIFVSFVMIALVMLVMNLLVFLLIDPIIRFMNIPSDVYGMMRDYLWVIFAGIGFVFLYNYFAALLRAVGNSLAPLLFLAVSAVTNIVLDLLFVVTFQRGVAGAAEATVIAQALSAVGIAAYTFIKFPAFRPDRRYMRMNRQILREIFQYAFLTCIQQSVMNFGILLVQGLVNSFGTAVMAAFAAAVKIDAFAYMPVQDFGNAFSTFVAQNYGAKKEERIRRGIRSAIGVTVVLLPDCVRAGLCLCAAADADLCPAAGDRDSGGGGAVPAHRGRLLLRDWLPVFALRPLPCGAPAGHVGGAHRHLAGHKGGTGLPAGLHPRHRGGGDLVVHPDWLAACRPGGAALLQKV